MTAKKMSVNDAQGPRVRALYRSAEYSFTKLQEQEVRLIAGLRNPCAQIENHEKGLLKVMNPRNEAGQLVRRAGIMAVVLASGTVREGDSIKVTLPDGPQAPLEVV